MLRPFNLPKSSCTSRNVRFYTVSMPEETWKIGKLASLTGVSIRTLHHYDEIALLSPSHRSPSGHRFYRREEVIRLRRILSLRQMGFSLDQIRKMLVHPNADTAQMIRLHIAAFKEQIAAQQELCARLEAVETGRGWAGVEQFIKAIEGTTMFDKYYTAEQLKILRKRAADLGEAHIREVEAEWPRLIADVRREMERGADPKDPRMLALAKRWAELVNEFTGGDPGITQSLKNLNRNEPAFASQQSLDRTMFDYVRRRSPELC
jgi:DNA-binding transcriptional MerR regulator